MSEDPSIESNAKLNAQIEESIEAAKETMKKIGDIFKKLHEYNSDES